MRYLKWAWRHYSLEVDEFDALDDAVIAADYAADAGLEALEGIEDTTMERWYGYDEVMDLARPAREAEWERIKAQPPRTHVVEILAPDSVHTRAGAPAWSDVESAYSAEEAEIMAQPWRSTLGPDRVRIRPTRSETR